MEGVIGSHNPVSRPEQDRSLYGLGLRPRKTECQQRALELLALGEKGQNHGFPAIAYRVLDHWLRMQRVLVISTCPPQGGCSQKGVRRHRRVQSKQFIPFGQGT
jgi:hypothetical protein